MPSKGSILLVEDWKDVREAFKQILENAGYEVETAISKKEAIDKLTERIYDAALVDLQLKDDPSHKGGIDVLQCIKDLGEGTKAFAVTGTTKVSDSTASWRAGIVDFLSKSHITSAKDLIGPIEKALTDHRRISFGSHGSLAAYLAKPEVTPIWESHLQETLGCRFDAMQSILWKALNPFFPILRKADGTPSLVLDKEKHAALGTFWSKGRGCAIWLAISAMASDLSAPPDKLNPRRRAQSDGKQVYAGIWEVKLPRGQFANSLKHIMPAAR